MMHVITPYGRRHVSPSEMARRQVALVSADRVITGNEVYLLAVAPVLRELHRRTGARLTLIDTTRSALGDQEASTSGPTRSSSCSRPQRRPARSDADPPLP
jgi:hypothetical protein